MPSEVGSYEPDKGLAFYDTGEKYDSPEEVGKAIGGVLTGATMKDWVHNRFYEPQLEFNYTPGEINSAAFEGGASGVNAIAGQYAGVPTEQSTTRNAMFMHGKELDPNDPNSQWAYDLAARDDPAARAVQGYLGIGEQEVTDTYTPSNKEVMDSAAMAQLNQQDPFLNELRSRAMGEGPSVAEMQMGQNIDRSIAASRAMAAGSANPAAAQIGASRAASNAMIEGSRNSAMLRAQEMQNAGQAYMGAAQNQQGLNQNMAQFFMDQGMTRDEADRAAAIKQQTLGMAQDQFEAQLKFKEAQMRQQIAERSKGKPWQRVLEAAGTFGSMMGGGGGGGGGGASLGNYGIDAQGFSTVGFQG